MLGDGEDILVAAAAHIEDDQAIFAQLLRHFANTGECMGWLKRRDDAFKFGAELESVQRFLVCRREAILPMLDLLRDQLDSPARQPCPRGAAFLPVRE